MITAQNLDPIFVHASARAASSYFFNVLRRNKAFLCFSSAIIDGKRDVADPARKPNMVWRRSDDTFDINHHFLERPDYYEFTEAWDAVMHLCPECPTFQDYLPSGGILSDDLRVFLGALIEHARSQDKRPVLCETNSRGRVAALQLPNPVGDRPSGCHRRCTSAWRDDGEVGTCGCDAPPVIAALSIRAAATARQSSGPARARFSAFICRKSATRNSSVKLPTDRRATTIGIWQQGRGNAHSPSANGAG